jgi:Do/DeqQ family serine protease
MKKIVNICLAMSVLALISCNGQNTPIPDNKTFISLEERQQLASPGELFSATASGVDFRLAAKKVTPAVVHIKATLGLPEDQSEFYEYRSFRDFWGEDWFRFFEPFRENLPAESSASGVILTDDGYIITNDHVVHNARDIKVVLHDQRSYTAKLIGTDPQTDLALLKIDETSLSFISVGNSDNVEVGEWVLAVGNPFNLASTVTAGIVSAKARNINILKDRNAVESYIQTDAAVNPGNSGGALVNLNGELIGINSAIATPTGAYAGYAFAIPVNIVKKVTDDLLHFGIVKRGYLGIYIHDMTSEIAKANKVKFVPGVYVDSVATGSAAAAGGIRARDIITKIDGVPVDQSTELQEVVARHHPGEKIQIVFVREEQQKEVTIQLKEASGVASTSTNERSLISLLGIEVKELTAQEKRSLGLRYGVKVTRITDGRIRQLTNMKKGFIILKVDGKTVNTTEDLIRGVENKSGGVMLEGIYPGSDMIYYYGFGM